MNELDMVRAARPEVPAPERDVLDAALVKVLDGAAPGPSRRLRAARPATRRRVLVAGGLAAVAAVGVGLVPVLGGNGTAPANAAVMLRKAAAAAQAETGTTPKPSQWVYTESKSQGIPGRGVGTFAGEGADPGRAASFHMRIWSPAKMFECTPRPEKARWCAVGRTSTVIRQVNGREAKMAALTGKQGWDADDQTFVRSLPTEAGALLRLVRARADRKSGWKGFDRDQEAVEVIADLMDGHIPQELRAALFKALSRIPGVRLDRDAADYSGRHGIGFSHTGREATTQIIVARDTYRYLGDRLTAVKDLPGGIKAGTVLRWSAQLRVALVDGPRRLPR